MANRQTRALKKLGLCTCNGGPSTTVSEIKHGRHAFNHPDVAIRRAKEDGRRRWRINKVHPDNPKKRD